MTRNRRHCWPTTKLKFSGLAAQISSLPAEIIHKIISDLPLTKLLEIACNNYVFLSSCILSHIVYQRMFTPAQLSELISLFHLYIKISSRRSSRPHPDIIAVLDRDAVFFGAFLKAGDMGKGEGKESAGVKQLVDYGKNCVAHTKAAIIKLLDVYGPYVETLRNYAPAPDAVASSSQPAPDGSNSNQPKETSSSASSSMDIDKPLPPVNPIPEIGDGSYSRLLARWEALDEAEKALCRAKSAQLNRLADFFSHYPGMLHSRTDSSQETPRNLEHAEKRYRALARLMNQPQILDQRFIARGVFKSDRFPLVPYDRFSKVFLKTLQRYPSPGLRDAVHSVADREYAKAKRHQDETYEEKLRQLEKEMKLEEEDAKGAISLRAFFLKDRYKWLATKARPRIVTARDLFRIPEAREPWEYPLEISRDIRTVVEGMAYVHVHTPAANGDSTHSPTAATTTTAADSPRLLRTKFTPFSATTFIKPFGSSQPTFVTTTNREGYGAGAYLRNELWRQIAELEEKEFEWLEAFLRCCKYMAGMDVPWAVGDSGGRDGTKMDRGAAELTVKEFWRRHT